MSPAHHDNNGSRQHKNDASSGRKRFEQALATRGDHLTPVERAIAAYIRDNLSFIPFETGASLASKVGVSEMSVVRFMRSLGYTNLKQLKKELRATIEHSSEATDNLVERFKVRRNEIEALRESLELELSAVVEAYQLTATERWHKASQLIAQKRFVRVVGYQAAEGLGRDFANRLKYARPRVSYAEDSDGVYAEILEAEPNDCCLVLVDIYAYARKGILLARRAKQLGIPIVVVTDHFSQFGYEFTDLVLQGHTHVKTFWDSTASITVILNLLINAVATELGKKAKERKQFLVQLGDYFNEFQRTPDPSNGQADI